MKSFVIGLGIADRPPRVDGFEGEANEEKPVRDEYSVWRDSLPGGHAAFAVMPPVECVVAQLLETPVRAEA